MRNRAKCKLCGSILESFHKFDYVSCKCGEISISGGMDAYECSAKSFSNFLRVDENGNEIVVKVSDEATFPIEEKEEDYANPSKERLIKMLDDLIQDIDKMPSAALQQPVTNYELQSVLVLLSAIVKSS